MKKEGKGGKPRSCPYEVRASFLMKECESCEALFNEIEKARTQLRAIARYSFVARDRANCVRDFSIKLKKRAHDFARFARNSFVSSSVKWMSRSIDSGL